ncbi:DUF3387 domain-containing protein [Streptomyces sp. ACA25]|uniref:type I restriction enzyme endonuclease domain-containing protein n=1 Tax=Streptomyces sp. ACA25 TaxID=3022596 RepID=UPI0023076425|nr:type I restriction enzyme endonuclease domain-containing protein [Streptomyces sp. ACA25]MDB1088112.1 DUF3387 domain-containing protein [Streptomyces sp. ACA25]
MRDITRHNIVRQKSFSARLEDLMSRYVRQQLTSAEVIAELVAMAKRRSPPTPGAGNALTRRSTMPSWRSTSRGPARHHRSHRGRRRQTRGDRPRPGDHHPQGTQR